MNARLRTRLAKLEFTRTIETEKRLVIRFGRLKRLPPDYEGERHVATVAGPGSDPAHPDWYKFEERTGTDPRPAETSGTGERVLTVHFVTADRERESTGEVSGQLEL
jgi:hypothetical protein